MRLETLDGNSGGSWPEMRLWGDIEGRQKQVYVAEISQSNALAFDIAKGKDLAVPPPSAASSMISIRATRFICPSALHASEKRGEFDTSI